MSQCEAPSDEDLGLLFIRNKIEQKIKFAIVIEMRNGTEHVKH